MVFLSTAAPPVVAGAARVGAVLLAQDDRGDVGLDRLGRRVEVVGQVEDLVAVGIALLRRAPGPVLAADLRH